MISIVCIRSSDGIDVDSVVVVIVIVVHMVNPIYISRQRRTSRQRASRGGAVEIHRTRARCFKMIIHVHVQVHVAKIIVPEMGMNRRWS